MAESTLIYAEPVLLYPEGCTERPWDDEESENSADADENAKAEEVANRRAIDFRRSQQSGGAGGASSMSLRSNYAPRHPISRASRNPSPIRVKEPQSQSQSQSQPPPQPQPQPHLPTRPTSRPRSRAKVRPPSSSNNRLLSMGPSGTSGARRRPPSPGRGRTNHPRSAKSQAREEPAYLAKHRDTKLFDVGTTSRTGRIVERLLPSRRWARDDPSLGVDRNFYFSLADEHATPHFVQRVSTVPPSRAEVAAMELEFDQRLRAKGARPRVGSICQVRKQLFSELFNEVIRQVALEMPERGIMLLRVRDELRLRLMAMLAIQEYASGFGTLGGKKEEAIRDLETRHGALEAEVAQLREIKRTKEHRLAAVEASEMIETDRVSMLREDERQALVLQQERLRKVLANVELEIQRDKASQKSKKKKKHGSIARK